MPTIWHDAERNPTFMLETGESRSVDLRKIETGLSGVQFIFLIELIKLSDASRLDLQHEGPKFFFALEPVLSSGKPVVGTSCNRYLSQIVIAPGTLKPGRKCLYAGLYNP